MTPVHRILIAPLAPTAAPPAANAHWRDHHSRIVPALEGLVGYVQNRPLPEYWGEVCLVCAESWFSSREAEAAAYAGEYYETTVKVDEERFIDRGRAWNSAVTATEVLAEAPRGGLRTLVFGEEEIDDAAPWDRVEVLRLRRGLGDSAPAALSTWTEDPERAADLAARFPGRALVTAPAAVVAPGPEWARVETRWHW